MSGAALPSSTVPRPVCRDRSQRWQTKSMAKHGLRAAVAARKAWLTGAAESKWIVVADDSILELI